VSHSISRLLRRMSKSGLPAGPAALLLALALVTSACGGQQELSLPYREDFEQASENWDVADDGIITYGFQDGRLVVTVNDFNASAWSTLNFTLTDFTLEVDTLKLAGPDDNGFGVLFRYQDPEDYYRFDVSSDGFYSVSKSAAGTLEEISPWKFSDAILLGEQTNRLWVTAQGNSFGFAVNDTPLALCVGEGAIWDPQSDDICLGGEVLNTWTDDSFPRGQIALGVTAFGESGPAIGFDNLDIRQPGT
jgi:hypothetical protein